MLRYTCCLFSCPLYASLGRFFSSIAILAFPDLVRAWRSECDVEGVEVEVTLHGAQPLVEGAPRSCRVAWVSHSDLVEGPPDLSEVDIIFTDSLRYVPFLGRRGNIHFLENISVFQVPEDLDRIMQEKTDFLSVLLPPEDQWDELTRAIYDQAQVMIPDHIYIDDGSPELHEAAFRRYRFALIADASNHSVSLPFTRSISFHTIAVYNGFVEVAAMVFNAIADFNSDGFSLPATMDKLRKDNEHLGALWHYQRILQDQFLYRYRRSFEERLLSQACSLCRLRFQHADNDALVGAATAGVVAPLTPPLVFVGVYSARRNFEKRQVVRETWGRFLLEGYRLRLTFFLGEASAGASSEELRMRREVEQFGDIVFLDIGEGYRMNSRKGLLFLQYVALHSEAEFLLKVDDDIYFRPAPLLQQLSARIPAQYAWGYWDYISPVPREEGDHFYNTLDDFPFDVFAPYPRGSVRAISMDVVRLLSKAGREGKLRMIYGDDPCIGVHLRQLLFDPEEPLPSLTLDDFDNKVFAMEPSCHPNLWSRMNNRTWVVHHVTPTQIRCMWDVDVREGYYETTPEGWRHNDLLLRESFPSLCECATDDVFEARTDLNDLERETNRILFGRDEP